MQQKFKVTTLKNPLLSITTSYKYKESYQTLLAYPKIPTYSWTLTPIPNWTCIVVVISLFNAWILVCD